MGTICVRKLIQQSNLTGKASLFRSRICNSAAQKLDGLAPKAGVSPGHRRFFTCRLAVTLGCSAESLMPLHSVTASALLNSMLSPKVGGWGFLSEGFATPL